MPRDVRKIGAILPMTHSGKTPMRRKNTTWGTAPMLCMLFPSMVHIASKCGDFVGDTARERRCGANATSTNANGVGRGFRGKALRVPGAR
jgi:hypothetical protein